jgi:CheY-like chemotaxis protein
MKPLKTKLNCILLIDDDESTNYLNRLIIEDVGCTESIQAVESGREALDFLTARDSPADDPEFPCPDIIFLDINMPGMSGWEFLEEYRKLPEEQRGNILVFMLTTSLNPDDEKRAHEITDVSDFIYKPLSEQILEKILLEHFKEHF